MMTRISSRILSCLIILLSVAVPGQHASAAKPESVSRKVTAEDLPRIPSTEADKALSTFRLARGFTVEQVAAEPLVGDPVDACFDENGRMYVAEMHGYPFSHEPTRLNPKGGGKLDAGIIRLLEDTDGDGRMDRSVVFADGISWPTSVCCYNGGVFVSAPQYLYYFKDTDGDGKADVREIILSGFGRDNVQAVTNGLKWNLDNRIYFAAGRNPKNLKHRGKPLFPVGASDLRFNPRTEEFEAVSGGVQFGHSIDDWGTRFVCSNSNHIQQVVYPQHYLVRNPYFVASGLIRSIAADGASARVFRISPPEPWRIIRQKWRAADKGYRLTINEDGGWEFHPLDPSKKAGAVPTEYPEGYFTSATGITIYRGNAYPDEYRGNAFVGDVGSNLVHRKTVNTDGIVYRAERADAGEEILASKDNWFRPVNFVNAPDGSLYILDMYRETIEHPYSIPEEIKKYLHLTSGHDRGRIYRLVSPDMKRNPPVRLGELDRRELVAQLASDNGWNRETAQRLLWERQDKAAAPLIEELLKTTDSPLGRMHALYALDGIGALTPDHIRAAIQDDHPRVRAHAVRLSESFLKKSPELLSALRKLCRDENPHVRFQLAFSLGESTDDQAVEALAELARDPQNSGEIQVALLSSVGQTAGRLTSRLIADPESLRQKHVAGIIAQLGLIIGANPKPQQALELLAAITSGEHSDATRQMVLTALGRGLARRGATIEQALQSDQATEELRRAVAELFDRATERAEDEELALAERRAAITLLQFADAETASDTLPEFLSPQTPQPLQQAAVQALGAQSSDDIAETLLEGWRTFSPAVRSDVVEALVATPQRTLALLSAVEEGTVKRGDLSRDVKQMLLKHRNATIKARSDQLLGGEVETNRSKVVEEYQDVLELSSDAVRGQQVFRKTCSKCHRVGGEGYQLAPDLASVKNKSTADLLISILDPNREAQPNFNTYTVVTAQGRSYSGIIATETANSITLRRAEGKEDVILRSNIDELIANGVSLMPEGLEKDLNRQDLADVIAFVKSIKSASGKESSGEASGGKSGAAKSGKQPGKSTARYSIEKNDHGVAVTVDGKPFAEYVLDQANKPYLFPVYGPTGKQMTRAWPMKDVDGERKDHPHHRGIVFGHEGIGGADTWSEKQTWIELGARPKYAERAKQRMAALGRIRHGEFTKLEGGKDSAVIHQTLDYLDASGKKVLTEKRRLTFRARGDVRIIDFDQDLIATEGDVTFEDKKDSGLSIRVPTSMDVDTGKGGTIINSEGDRDKQAWSKAGTWCDYNGPVGGEHLGVAILNHPSSFRHPTRWHVRSYGLFTANPFAAQQFDKSLPDAGFELKDGETIRLRHRFILHRGDEKAAKIAEAWKSYAKEKK